MDAVLFDMDGVLVDSEDYWIPYEEEELIEKLGDDDIDVHEMTGMNYRELFDHLDAEYDLAMDRAAFLAWYEETAERIYSEEASLLTDAQDLIEELRSRGVTVVIVSSSPHDWIDMVRERFAVDVDDVVSADAIEGPGKPAPAVYEIAAERIGVDPEDCVAVEDSLHGIEAASRAGMHVVGFRHGRADDTDRSDADFVADSPADLREHLLSRADETAE